MGDEVVVSQLQGWEGNRHNGGKGVSAKRLQETKKSERNEDTKDLFSVEFQLPSSNNYCLFGLGLRVQFFPSLLKHL
jgi:hypothetical protein